MKSVHKNKSMKEIVMDGEELVSHAESEVI